MPEALIHFEAGQVLADLQERTITTCLIPFGEVGRTNVGRFQVMAGAVALPADPAVISLNLDHDRTQNVGRATLVEERADGVYATFSIARTPKGDAALADAISPTGLRRKMSAEFGPAVLAGGRMHPGTGAELWGAALVTAGAFPSAQVLAADTVEVDGYELPAESSSSSSYSTTGSDGSEYSDSTTSTEEVEDLGDGKKRITRTTVTVTEITEPDDESDEDTTNESEEEPSVPVPNTVEASAVTTQPRRPDLSQVYAAVATYRTNPHDATATQVLAALTDITLDGANPLGGVIQPNWLGELLEGVTYVQQYLPLYNPGTNISAAGKKGYKLRRGAAGAQLEHFDGEWAGNKNPIKSGKAFHQIAESDLYRFAIGNDIGREFIDLPGGAEVVEAFMRLIVEDHSVWADEIARDKTIELAAARTVAPAPVPERYTASPAIGMLIQGVLAAKRKKADGMKDTPSFVIANTRAYEQLVYAPRDYVPEFITFSAGLDGEATVGSVRVIEGETGIEDTASVIVGAGYGIDYDQIAGGPIKVDALEIAKGGIDRAVHGYLQEFVRRPEAFVRVGVADS